MRPSNRLCLGAVLLACLAGCGSSEDPAKAPAPQADPCALVSQAEAAQALAQEVQPGQPRDTANPLGQRICFYSGTGSEPPLRFVQVSLVTSRGMQPGLREQGYSAGRLYADSKALLENPEEIAGLGQAAFFGGGGLKAGAGLHVLKGESYLVIQVASGEAKRNLDLAKGLAAKALARLP